MSWIAAGSAVVSIGAGIYKDVKAAKAQKAALARRRPFQTAKELIDANNIQRSLATQGFTPETLDYFTNQNDRGFASSLNSLQLLGGDANAAAALFDQKIQNTFKIGSENTLLNMQNFDKFLNSERYLAQNKDAEWASQQGMIKDEQAAAQQRRLEAAAQISNGINTGISAYSNYKVGQLYNPNIPRANQDPFVPVAVTNSRTGLDTQLPL